MNQRRLQELDGLRGFAALIVVLFHYLYHFDIKYGHAFVVPQFLSLGKTGVHLFFMVSGFVIFWTLSRCKHPVDFVFSRFSRLYPAYWVAVLFTFIWVVLVGPEDRARDIPTLLANLTMWQEFLGFSHVDGVYWTLSVELHFYMLALIALILGLVRYTDWLCFFWLLGSLITITGGLWLWGLRPYLLVEWSYLFGAGIAFYRLWHGDSRYLPLATLVLSYSINWLINPVDCALMISGYYLLMAGAIYGKLRWLRGRPLLWLGGISYALYLIHQNFGYGLFQWGYVHGINPWIMIPTALTLSMVLAVFLTRFETVVQGKFRGWYKDYRKQKSTANTVTTMSD